MAAFKPQPNEPSRSIADKVLGDGNPGSAKTRNGVDVGDAPRSDLRRPVATSGEATKGGEKNNT